MKMNCFKCDIKKCKAQCCTWVPFNINFLEKNADKMVRPVFAIVTDEKEKVGKPITHVEKRIENGKEVDFIDERKQICPFLTDNYKCNIYKNRPEICKCFGTKLSEDHPFTCHFHIGRNYHFPDKKTPEFLKINNIKYYPEIIKNRRLVKEMFPGITK